MPRQRPRNKPGLTEPAPVGENESMPDAKLIGRPLKDTPSGQKSTPGGRRLPPDLLRQASHRLQIMALIGAGLWTLGVGLGHFALHSISPDDPRWAQFNISDLIAVGSVGLSLGLFFYLRKGDRDPAGVVNLSEEATRWWRAHRPA